MPLLNRPAPWDHSAMVTGVRAMQGAFRPLCPGRQLGICSGACTSCISSSPADWSLPHALLLELPNGAVYLEFSSNLEKEKRKKKKKKRFVLVVDMKVTGILNLFLEKILGIWIGSGIGVGKGGGPSWDEIHGQQLCLILLTIANLVGLRA